MNILFIGRFYPKDLYKIINQDPSSKINFSDHNFTLSLIKGLSSQHNIDLKVLSAPGVYSYPYNNKYLYTHAEKYLINGIPISSIGFCNLFILNKINIILKLIFKIIAVGKKFKKGKIHVILSSPNIYLLLALFVAKKISFNKIDKFNLVLK